MDKIIGIGNALVDILARIGDEKTLKELRLPVGSMQLIDENRLAEMRRFLPVYLQRSLLVGRRLTLFVLWRVLVRRLLL